MIIESEYGTYHGDCVDGTGRDGMVGWEGIGSETNSIDGSIHGIRIHRWMEWNDNRRRICYVPRGLCKRNATGRRDGIGNEFDRR